MRYLILLLTFFTGIAGFSNKTAAEIYVDLQKVHSLKRVLYIAAHPDDENTRALAWFSLSEKAETAYLSLTRGDGGQNLIGDEFNEDLGVLRTQELLAARSIDRANQFFSRAVDFGYSKSADESFEKWGKDEILSDVVLVIRQFKPDVIITRFPPDKRAGHGHHTASAMLAIEAFEKAADPNYLPNQVKALGTWKTTSIYWNTSIWWDKELDDKTKNDPSYMIQDIGGYNSLLGMSYNEIGTLARSQHKCQGFGAIVERGSRKEYFEHLGGEKLQSSFFEKNKLSWSQFVNEQFEKDFNDLITNFNFTEPEKNVEALLHIRTKLAGLPTSPLKEIQNEKVRQLDQIIFNCLGLYIEVVSDDYAFAQNDSMEFTYNFINRSSMDVSVNGLSNREILMMLPQNEVVSKKLTHINGEMHSTPYWLYMPFTNLFKVVDPTNLGRAENIPTFNTVVDFNIQGTVISTHVPVTYKWRDPSYGERRRNAISTPNYTVNFDQKSVIQKPGVKSTLRLKVHSFKSNLDDELFIQTPAGWTITPNKIKLDAAEKHEEIWVECILESTSESERGNLILTDSEGDLVESLTEITYDHIPAQVIFKTATLECINLDARIVPSKIAYIEGAGDAVPEAITQLGFDVDVFSVSDLAEVNLSSYQSVVLGIRIYNVHPELHNFDTKLFDYVEKGGNVVMQYNTASRSAKGSFGPIPFELSRNRVTEEDSKVEFLAPDHPIMNKPNKITQADFDNWVQERGLYFAQNWDEKYTPLFAWHDKGENAQKGGLIVAKHGRGQFVYTGISFFRELPNGVEGAYRLFANLLSYQP